MEQAQAKKISDDVEVSAQTADKSTSLETEQDTETKLLRLAQEGRKDAFDVLMAQYQPRIYSWASKMSRSLNVQHSEIPDIVQEALIRAWLNISKFRGDSKLSTWLYTITRHQAINHSKKNQRYANTYNISEIESLNQDSSGTGTEKFKIDYLAVDRDSPDEIFIGQEVKRKVMEIIENLPPNLKNIIILREIEQLSYEQISVRTGSKLGTVKTQIHRAREKIDTELAKWARGEN